VTAPAIVLPLYMFRFHVHCTTDPVGGGGGTEKAICGGAFAECTGLEATMEPKVIKEGGRNNGAVQRAGPITFGTVILKRGMTPSRDLWTWFDMLTNQHLYAYRLAATINVYDHAGKAVFAWKLSRAMPVKFKAADLNARGTEVGVEELHLAHEGLTLVDSAAPGSR
jgi:phage tail-like protein